MKTEKTFDITEKARIYHTLANMSSSFSSIVFQNDDGRLHAGFGNTETPGTGSLGGLDHAHGNRISRMISSNVVECCGIYGQDAANLLILWRPRRDLNPCYRRESTFLAPLLLFAVVCHC